VVSRVFFFFFSPCFALGARAFIDHIASIASLGVFDGGMEREALILPVFSLQL